MSDDQHPIHWSKTTFGGSRREQLLRARSMNLRERLEALEDLTALSERLQAMPRQRAAHPADAAVGEEVTGYRAVRPGREVVLAGCTPTPLCNYLKALGVLRLLSAKHPETRGFWRGEEFVLASHLHREDIEWFFLNEYRPTPVMAPWNGGSGFYEKDNKVALNAILGSRGRRLQPYRTCLAISERTLAGMDRSTSPKHEQKSALLQRIRGSWPETLLDWFDAVVSLSGGSEQYPPILGTGGNDGRFDFTNNFMQNLLVVLDPDDGSPPQTATGLLNAALFAEVIPGLVKNAIGQFAPGQAGGPNATTGFGGTSDAADARINPWDFVLMVEGALSFAASVVRRNAADDSGVLSYPFTVRAVNSGAGNLGEGDAQEARGELWMPLWRNPATFREVRALMAEGRVAFGRKPARDAVDFVRAVTRFGSYRGIQAFERYGLLKRSGKAYLATPLARVAVVEQAGPRWIDELDHDDWLDRFRRFAQGKGVPQRLVTLRRRLEDALFAFSGREPPAAETQALLHLLGEIQRALANARSAMAAVRPLPHLSERWVTAADDGTTAFRIAAALAGLRGVGDVHLPLRAQLFPVHPRFVRWATPHSNIGMRLCIGRRAALVGTLTTFLGRRLWLAEKLEMPDRPLQSPAGVTLTDVLAFLRGDAMDERIDALLPGLSLCRVPQGPQTDTGPDSTTAAFGLLKLVHTPKHVLRDLGVLAPTADMPVPAGILARLAAGNHANRAVRMAWQRLRASGLSPAFSVDALPVLSGIEPGRAAAALLIPLRFGATARLARSVLKTDSPQTTLV